MDTCEAHDPREFCGTPGTPIKTKRIETMRAYSEVYLDEVVENQGKLFDYIAHEFLMMNTEDFINTYMVSKTRNAIDRGQAYVNTMDAQTLWDYFVKTEDYSLKLGIVNRENMCREYPFYIGKTINVAMQPPYNLMVEFETGEKRVLNIEKYIDETPSLRVLKEKKKLLYSPIVSPCGYMTAWEEPGFYREFHNDLVFINGKDIVGALGGFFPMWLGEFYAYYQWYYNLPSSEIIRRLPISKMKTLFWGLRDYPLEIVIEKVGLV